MAPSTQAALDHRSRPLSCLPIHLPHTWMGRGLSTQILGLFAGASTHNKHFRSFYGFVLMTFLPPQGRGSPRSLSRGSDIPSPEPGTSETTETFFCLHRHHSETRTILIQGSSLTLKLYFPFSVPSHNLPCPWSVYPRGG